jgi:hypothetical protein
VQDLHVQQIENSGEEESDQRQHRGGGHLLDEIRRAQSCVGTKAAEKSRRTRPSVDTTVTTDTTDRTGTTQAAMGIITWSVGEEHGAREARPGQRLQRGKRRVAQGAQQQAGVQAEGLVQGAGQGARHL